MYDSQLKNQNFIISNKKYNSLECCTSDFIKKDKKKMKQNIEEEDEDSNY